MRNIDCENLRREIDEANPGDSLSVFASRHMESCGNCQTLSEQQRKLQNILSSLGAVDAPGDFDFRLRARLARDKAGNAGFPLTKMSFGYRSAAVAALVLIFGSVMFFSFRGTSNDSLTAENVAPVVVGSQAPAVAPRADQLVAVDKTPAITARKDDSRPAIQPKTNRASTFIARNSSKVGSRDLGSTPATLIKTADLNARNVDFAIEAVNQPVKVSLDNAKGASRTISLPPVSYGSQRVLGQGSVPLMASSRGAW